MKLLVVSHKICWSSELSKTGYATDGGFPFQIKALSELFDETTLLLPLNDGAKTGGEISLEGRHLSVRPLSPPWGRGLWRKTLFPFWCLSHFFIFIDKIRKSDAVHAPIPGDVGTAGMMLALIFQKNLFVRYCGNWLAPKTLSEHLWKGLMEHFAGGRNVMLATGGGDQPPSLKNKNIKWIFATTLSKSEMPPRSPKIQKPVPKLIIVCRQDRRKGTGIVLEALVAILKEKEVGLDVVGAGPDLKSFEVMAEKLGIKKHVVFYGNVSHNRVLGLLSEADLFCYPTASEGFPKVVLEALAVGLPVITTPVSVLPSLIASGCGIIIDKADAGILAEAILKCLGDPKAYKEMSRKALEIAQSYSLEKWRDEIGGHLEKAWGRLFFFEQSKKS